MSTTTTNTPFPSTESGLGSSAPGAGLDTGSGASMSGTGMGSSTESVVNRVVAGAHQAVDRLAEKAVPAVERLRGSVSGASESLHQRADQLSELQDEWLASVRTTVREHPLATIGAAVVVGVLISRMMSSR